MSRSVDRALASVAQLFATLSDHVSGADLVRKERAAKEQGERRMTQRIESLRAGFGAIRERHENLSERLRRERLSQG